MKVYFIFTLILVALWFFFTYYCYQSLQILNSQWDNYVANPTSDKMPIIDELQYFDKCIVALFIVNSVVVFTFMKILSDYSTKGQDTALDSFLQNNVVVAFLMIVVMCEVLSFFYIWNTRRHALSEDTQFTHKTGYNASFYTFAICGIVLIPILLIIAYNTPFSKNDIKQKNEIDYANDFSKKYSK